LQAGYLPGKGIGDIRFIRLNKVFTLNFLQGIAKRLPLTSNTQCGYDHLVERLIDLHHGDIEYGFVTNGSYLNRISNHRKLDHLIGRCLESKTAVFIGLYTSVGSFNEYTHSGERTHSIRYRPGNGLLRESLDRRERQKQGD